MFMSPVNLAVAPLVLKQSDLALSIDLSITISIAQSVQQHCGRNQLEIFRLAHRTASIAAFVGDLPSQRTSPLRACKPRVKNSTLCKNPLARNPSIASGQFSWNASESCPSKELGPCARNNLNPGIRLLFVKLLNSSFIRKCLEPNHQMTTSNSALSNVNAIRALSGMHQTLHNP